MHAPPRNCRAVRQGAKPPDHSPMQDADFSDEFCQFVQSTIPTVEAAEALLALAANSDAWSSRDEFAAKVRLSLNIPDAEAGRYVELFQSRGLVEVRADRRMRYRPASEALARHVEALARAFTERPVTLIRMIYALRDAKIRSFADAFRLSRS